MGAKFKVFYGFIVTILMICPACITSSKSYRNYTALEGPSFEGHYAEIPPSFSGVIKVVTWNLSFGEKVTSAISTLRHAEPLRDADVLLLQEIDEQDTELIARDLGYNFVYYPATIHSKHGENFGNAILSRWEIGEHRKIILPNIRQQTRIAVIADVLINGVPVKVINVHLETIWMLNLIGKKQPEYLFDNSTENQLRNVLIGGDFNTWSGVSIKYLENKFGTRGLKRVSAGSGYTFQYAGLRLTLDHIWTNDTHETASGVWRDTDASDHYPLWVELKFD
jgi:endonuclease/exonuclease/phosphatase family metal-dependent hydrolase